MIQELLGGSSVAIINGGGDRSKLSTTSCGGGAGGILDHSSPSPSPSNSSPSSAGAGAPPENLRCPRCDSANTKFCYYNNYNLTQPRHFCKTCRRYWTKGGALRNVPIGGGCRKNKTTAKFKSAPPEMSKGLFDPIIWASSQNSHFLSLIRNNQTPLNPTHLPIKDEASLFNSDPAHYHSAINNNMPNPLYRNTQGILHGEAQNHGLQELYHRLRLSSNCYPDHAPLILGNMASPNSSGILESAPVAGAAEMGFWNSNISWPADLPTTNGAYP